MNRPSWSKRSSAIAFDQTGMVADIRQYGIDDLRDVDPNDRITSTAGKKLGFFEQLIGNIGRFTRGREGE